MSIKVIFTRPNGENRECVAEAGEKLLAVAQANGFDVEGACGGALACATCHVVVDTAWYQKLPPPSVDESDMLDLATGRTRTSRLSCQVTLTDNLDGILVKLL
jgi:2Fe-2S ferredoxin